ncbi:cytochrome P450 [Amycolatopsis suaedae]|uniref:Cytochrome P450 n=1 Tax=Amycolatopsis suaedae TaxID=2510978 RepID=A0A4Q7J135_9PSEU|nr:cytochrome P450 [Amycolatopsis suaedae]RZQ60438.1 cytochrome P450 [Amycolatopsis suaedae]
MTLLRDTGKVIRSWTDRAALAALAAAGNPLAGVLRDPAGEHAVYAKLRARGPVHRPMLGPPLVLSHRVCGEVLRDNRFGLRRADGGSANGENFFSDTFIEQDPPDHTRLRRLAAPAFRPKLLRDYRDRIEKITRELLHTAVAKGEFDLVTDFASPLPIAVISDLLGIPDEHAGRFARYGVVVARSLNGVRTLAQQRELDAAVADLGELFADLMRQRQADPRDDVISLLATAQAQDKLSAGEVVTTCRLLLIAGFETTVNLIGTAAKLLTDHPEQWALLKQDPDLAPRAVEEVLRYSPPVPIGARISQQPAELDGEPVQPQTLVVLLFAAANRDPGRYAEPDRFLLTRSRDEPEHLSFSQGIHYCLGAPLSRVEGDVALRAMAELTPGLRVTGEPVTRPSSVIRGLLHLPVAV